MNNLRYEVGFGLVGKLLCPSFQRYIIHVPFLYFWEFRIFGHVTGDVIIWSRDQIWEKFWDQNFSGHNLGKVTKHHSERYSRFGYMTQFIVPRAC